MKILIANEIFKDKKFEYDEIEDLKIIGNIPAEAKIRTKSKKSKSFNIDSGKFKISGNICGNVIEGNNMSIISNNGRTRVSGVTRINGKHVNDSHVVTTNGNSCANLTITGNVGQGAEISLINANITVNGDIEQGAKIDTVNGSINADTVHNHATIKTVNGDISINDDKRSKGESRRERNEMGGMNRGVFTNVGSSSRRQATQPTGTIFHGVVDMDGDVFIGKNITFSNLSSITISTLNNPRSK